MQQKTPILAMWFLALSLVTMSSLIEMIVTVDKPDVINSGLLLPTQTPAPYPGGYQTLAVPFQTNGSCCGWGKFVDNPVIGSEDTGTVFDVSVLHENGVFKMWTSWRDNGGIGYTESTDGIHWKDQVVVLAPNPASKWENEVNRPNVLRREDGSYHMWYTGQTADHLRIGYATSRDGIHWQRHSDKPVMIPDKPWEKSVVLGPSVIWDAKQRLYRMWYSGGELVEPDALGYATSPDGSHWTKLKTNPIFGFNPNAAWESDKVAAAHVLQYSDGWYYMFYIGFQDIWTAQIGMARSRDGISDWQRFPGNPIIRMEAGEWDADGVYKPFVIWDGKRWYLWYNGRSKRTESIGLAVHEGDDLGFPSPTPTLSK